MSDVAVGAPLRLRLRNRRMGLSARVDVLLHGNDNAIRLHVTAGFDVRLDYATGKIVADEPPVVREVWVRGRGPVGSERDLALDDYATSISLLLQCGYTPFGLRASLGSADPADGRSLTLYAAIVDQLVTLQEELRDEWLARQKVGAE